MNRILVLFFLVASFLCIKIAAASPEKTLPTSDFSELKQTGKGTVTQIIDPYTLQLHDGQLVYLSGIHYPDYDLRDIGAFSLTAKRVLRDMLIGQNVTLYQTPKKDWGRKTAMGHDLAHVRRESDKAWVQGSLLSLGLTMVKTGQRTPEMAEEMYKHEQSAREHEAGLWSTPAFRVRNTEEIDPYEQNFIIAEGKIISTAIKKNRIYLNFGKDWRSDFTVSIAPEHKRIFSKQGIDPLSWNNRDVRVRGWVRSYNGPYMEINHPEALELISPALDSNH